MTDWEKLRDKIRKHVYYKRGCGRFSRMCKIIGVSSSTMDNWLNRGVVPNYNKGVALEKYIKKPLPDPVEPVKKEETHYEMLKRTNQLK